MDEGILIVLVIPRTQFYHFPTSVYISKALELGSYDVYPDAWKQGLIYL